ncbi:MAG: hypothetical protein H0T46_27470 [Deltaproteobacteria bacterium]|nr:hypothetical protein [Deltaproteobacteria bacterium]
MPRAIGYLALALALAGACTKATSTKEPPSNDPGVGPRPVAAAKISLTSVAFADDCGGQPPANAPAKTAAAAESSEPAPKPARAAPAAAIAAKEASRRCEQTSMQLSIAAASDVDVRVTSVEVLDESGKSLGTLVSSKPTRWSDAQAAYQPWDGKVVSGQTALVSYVLSQPSFVSSYDERDRTYTVKVVTSVGGVEQPLQTTVMVVARPAPVPT